MFWWWARNIEYDIWWHAMQHCVLGWVTVFVSFYFFVCVTDSADTQHSQTAEAWRESLFPSCGSEVPMGIMFLRQSRPLYDQQDLKNIMSAQVAKCQKDLILDQFLSLNDEYVALMSSLGLVLYYWAFLIGCSIPHSWP